MTRLMLGMALRCKLEVGVSCAGGPRLGPWSLAWLVPPVAGCRLRVPPARVGQPGSPGLNLRTALLCLVSVPACIEVRRHFWCFLQLSMFWVINVCPRVLLQFELV